jgi:hypothetical protein
MIGLQHIFLLDKNHIILTICGANILNHLHHSYKFFRKN